MNGPNPTFGGMLFRGLFAIGCAAISLATSASEEVAAEWTPVEAARLTWAECLMSGVHSASDSAMSAEKMALIISLACDDTYTDYVRENAIAQGHEIPSEPKILNASANPAGDELLKEMAKEISSQRASGKSHAEISADDNYKRGKSLFSKDGPATNNYAEAYLRMAARAGNAEARCSMVTINFVHGVKAASEKGFSFYADRAAQSATSEIAAGSSCMSATMDKMAQMRARIKSQPK